jgi:ribosomal protein S19
MLERPIQKKILAESAKWPDVRLFRNNVGAYSIAGRFIRYGLHTGSGDLIGWKTVTITPQMIGRKMAVFVSVETKKTRGEPTIDQKTWARAVAWGGGIACVADSVEKAEKILK